MLDFIKEHTFLVIWGGFVALAYIFVYLDYCYYKHNIKDKLKQAYEAITEEE